MQGTGGHEPRSPSPPKDDTALPPPLWPHLLHPFLPGPPGLCFSPAQLWPLQTHGFLQCGISLDSKTPLAGVTGTSWPESPASGFWAGWPRRGPGGRLESIRGGGARDASSALLSRSHQTQLPSPRSAPTEQRHQAPFPQPQLSPLSLQPRVTVTSRCADPWVNP